MIFCKRKFEDNRRLGGQLLLLPHFIPNFEKEERIKGVKRTFESLIIFGFNECQKRSILIQQILSRTKKLIV